MELRVEIGWVKRLEGGLVVVGVKDLMELRGFNEKK